MHKKFAPRMYLAKKLRASRACIHLQVQHETSPVTFNIVAWIIFITKFPYNARSDWLKQRPLSENIVQVNDIKLAFKFLLRNFDKFDPN